MTSITKDIKAISIRKLKKYFIIRSRCRYHLMYDDRNVYIYVCRNDADVLKYPNLYVNKKFIESNMTYANRDKTHLCYHFKKVDCLFEKVVGEYDTFLDNFSFDITITLYTIFESENDYLKWKLSV